MSAALAPHRFHHLAIQVVDLSAVERFYVDVLGLSVERRWPAADGQGERSVWVATGEGGFLALERVAGPVPPDDPQRAGPFLVALGIRRADRAAWIERLARAGVAVERTSAYTVYVRDPEGNRVGLSHWPEAIDAPR